MARWTPMAQLLGCELDLRRDIQVVQALVLIFALSYVVINLIVDLTYAWLDPRIHYT